jgi:hypothetical protein
VSLLTEQERHHPLWLKLKEHFEARLDKARIKNDGSLSVEETARLRGRISELKAFLSLDQDLPGPANPVEADF